MDVAQNELKVDAQEVLGLGDWKTSSDDVAVARVPYHQDPRRPVSRTG
jgi:hypothetical protein